MEEGHTKDKILHAALNMFVEKGFDRTTVREVASHAKANVALIQYYFESKEKLFAELVELKTAQFRLRLTDITNSSSDPLDKLWQVIDFYVDRLHVNREYYQMVHRELSTRLRPELHESIMKILKRNSASMKEIFEEGQKKKIFRKEVDIDLTITTIFGLMYQTTHTEFRKKIMTTGETPDDFRKRVKDHLWDMLKRLLIK